MTTLANCLLNVKSLNEKIFPLEINKLKIIKTRSCLRTFLTPKQISKDVRLFFIMLSVKLMSYSAFKFIYIVFLIYV